MPNRTGPPDHTIPLNKDYMGCILCSNNNRRGDFCDGAVGLFLSIPHSRCRAIRCRPLGRLVDLRPDMACPELRADADG
jgi:hypothetical protein